MIIDLKKNKSVDSIEVNIVEKNWEIYNLFSKDISLTSSNLSDKKKERFYSEFHMLLSAGIDMKSALELISEEEKNLNIKELYQSIKKEVISGKSLSQTLMESGKFSTYEYQSIRIGEESGKLNWVLNQLTTYFTSKIKQKRQLLNAISYPAIVLVTALGAVFFMMNFVVPMFTGIFKRFKGELPYLTQLVINASATLTNYSLLLFLSLCLTAGIFYTQRKTNWFRKYSSALILRIPFIQDLIRMIYLARFCQSMNLLISSHTPLVESIELVKKMIGFYPIELALEPVREDLMHGKTISQSLSKHKIFYGKMITLIKVAEEVNQLELVFEKLSKQYTEEIEHKTGLMGTLLEPIMIVFLGLLVAIILIAMYLPLFKLSSAIGV